MVMNNWYTKSQTQLSLPQAEDWGHFRIDFTPQQKLPRQKARARGVYLTQSLSMAMAYANGRTRDAHMGARKVYDGVIFEVVLSDSTSHIGGDVWETWRDELVSDLKQFKQTGQLGSSTTRLFEAAGIEEITPQIADQVLRNPDSLLDSIDHRSWTGLQEADMGYSEIVLDSLSWDMIHEIWVYDDEGHLVKNIPGGFTDPEKFEDAKAEMLVYYHGSPKAFWGKQGL